MDGNGCILQCIISYHKLFIVLFPLCDDEHFFIIRVLSRHYQECMKSNELNNEPPTVLNKPYRGESDKNANDHDFKRN